MSRITLRVVVGIASAGLFLLGLVEIRALQPPEENGVLPTNPPTPYIHYISQNQPHRRALVVHGLDSSKEFMQIFSSALADAGVEVYAIDLPGHGDSTAALTLRPSSIAYSASALPCASAAGRSRWTIMADRQIERSVVCRSAVDCV